MSLTLGWMHKVDADEDGEVVAGAGTEARSRDDGDKGRVETAFDSDCSCC